MTKKNYLAIFAKSFNWAGFFLPKKVYEDCAKLYAFCRILDDIADEKKNLDPRIEKYSKIKKNFKMNFFEWNFKDPLTINKFGIPEPISDNLKYPDILLVPMVAFDNHLNRIGYGGGYYDRYIQKVKKNKKIILIGLAYSFQKVKKIPANRYDMKLDFIVTDKNFI